MRIHRVEDCRIKLKTSGGLSRAVWVCGAAPQDPIWRSMIGTTRRHRRVVG